MRFLIASLVAAAGLFASGQALAQDIIIQEEDKVVYKQTTVVDFNEVTLDGELTKPEGSYSITRTRTGFDSLIQTRGNFLPELQKSVDNL